MLGSAIFSMMMLNANEVDRLVQSRGTLIFEDHFERNEKDDSKEDLGKKWVTNSAKRAKGDKQADLNEGRLEITMSDKADHGVSVRHDAPFDDGVIKARFMMNDSKGIGFNFNDPKCKESHAGHICHLGVKPTGIDFRDGKTGTFSLAAMKIKKSGGSKSELKKLLKGKSKVEKMKLEKGKWYDVAIVIEGPKMTAYLDGKEISSFSSEGIDHPVKQNLAFSVSGKASVDDLQIYKLK